MVMTMLARAPKSFTLQSSALLFLTVIVCLMPASSSAEDITPAQWERSAGKWQMKEGSFTSGALGFHSLVSTRENLRDFDLAWSFRRIEGGKEDNHVGLSIARDTGTWVLFFRGDRAQWYFKPRKPASEKEKMTFKGHTPVLCPMDATIKVVAKCSQEKIVIEVNGAKAAEFGPAPGGGAVSFYTYHVKAEIFDIRMTNRGDDDAPGPQERPTTINLIGNPSFEICANPDIPDGWTHEPGWGNEADESWCSAPGYERWHQHWSLDTSRPFHGGRTMKVKHPLRLHGMVHQMAKGTDYTFSAHLRSDRDDLLAFIGAASPGRRSQGEEVHVGKRWKRYFVKFSPYALPDHPYRSLSIVPKERGTLWIDAVQLEKGHAPSAFSPGSPLDARFARGTGAQATGVKDFLPEARIEQPSLEAIKLDGILDDKLWQTRKKHLLCDTNGVPPDRKTEISFSATPKGLLIGAKSYTGVKDVPATERERDSGAIFGDDSIELFIDPSGEGREYYQLVFNAYGSQFDQKCQTGRSVDNTWNSKWRVSTARREGFWSGEAFVPFSDLFPDAKFPGAACLRVNVCRNLQEPRELQNWSPTYGVFHLPERFGFLFAGDVSAARSVAEKRVETEEEGEDLQAFYEFNYYTTEKVASLFLRALSGGTPSKANVEIHSPRGQLVFGKSMTVTEDRLARMEIPIGNWPTGKYRTLVRRLPSSGKRVHQALPLKKLEPSTVREVKIDHLRRTINVDGKPLFPFGVLWTRWAKAEALYHLSQAGFNTIWMGDKWSPLPMERYYLSLADKLGINVVETRYLHYWKDDAVKLQTRFMNNTSGFRCVVARMYVDEPGREPDKARQLIDLAAKQNPYVPSYVNYNSWGLYQRFAGYPGPILSIDRYPIGSGRASEIYTVEKVAEFMEKEALPRRMPVWIILQGTGHRRNPTAAELNFMTYVSIIRGARGIAYWAGLPRPRATWERMKELSSEVKALSPILFSAEQAPEITVMPASTIATLVKQHNGGMYVIALNRSRQPCNAEFFIAGTEKKTRCKVLFESRELPLEGSRPKLKDSFQGFERHVYELK